MVLPDSSGGWSVLESWPGTSLILAYSHCIAHGIDMSKGLQQQALASSSGYWPLYRFRPSEDEHEHPFQLDSAAPSIPLRDFALKEARYAMLARTDPRRSEELLDLAQAAIDERWHFYEQLVDVERTLPHVDDPDEHLLTSDEMAENAATADEEHSDD